jgi:hypothetical protein
MGEEPKAVQGTLILNSRINPLQRAIAQRGKKKNLVGAIQATG